MSLQRVLTSLDQGQRLNIILGHNAPTSCGAYTKQELRKVDIICWLTYDFYLLLLIVKGVGVGTLEWFTSFCLLCSSYNGWES